MVLYSADMLQLYASNILIVILHRIYGVGPVVLHLFLKVASTAWKSPFNPTVNRYNIHKNLTFNWIYVEFKLHYIASLISIYHTLVFHKKPGF